VNAGELDLIALGNEIARYEKPRASARLRAHIRHRLLTAPAQPRHARRFAFSLAPLRPLLAAAVVIMLLSEVAGIAAAASLPGDPAFTLKRAGETVEVAIAGDDISRLTVLVAQADRRLSDLHTALVTRPSAVDAAAEEYALAVVRVDVAAETVATDARSARRDAALALAGAASQSHLDILRALASTLPGPAQAGLARATEAHQRIRGRSGSSTPAVTPAVAPATPTIDTTTTARPSTAAPGRPSSPPAPRR
jgi:hypothetical protein